MLDVTQLNIQDVVPHSARMCLLDKVLSFSETTLSASVTPRADPLFCQHGKIGAWVGIEYMAQAIAAWAGCHARQQNRSPRIGFLLGTRRYQAYCCHFTPAQTLTVDIEMQFQSDNGLGQFACRILQGNQCLAEAQLKVFEPQDQATFLEIMP